MPRGTTFQFGFWPKWKDWELSIASRLDLAPWLTEYGIYLGPIFLGVTFDWDAEDPE